MAAKFTCPYCGTRQEIDPGILVDEQECVHCGKLMVERAISERPLRRRVRRRQEDDDSDDDCFVRKSTGIPGAAIAAGVVWIVFGSLSVLGAILQLVTTLAGGEQDGGGASYRAGRMSGMFCGAAIGAAFIRAGIQTVRGSADDVQGNAIGSLLLGGLYALLGLVALFASIDLAKVVGLIMLFLALTLFAAGAIALSARSDYLEYRDKPRRRRRRR